MTPQNRGWVRVCIDGDSEWAWVLWEGSGMEADGQLCCALCWGMDGVEEGIGWECGRERIGMGVEGRVSYGSRLKGWLRVDMI